MNHPDPPHRVTDELPDADWQRLAVDFRLTEMQLAVLRLLCEGC